MINLELFHRFITFASNIDFWLTFQKSHDIDRYRYHFTHVESKGKELIDSLSIEYDKYHANEKLNDNIFSHANENAFISK